VEILCKLIRSDTLAYSQWTARIGRMDDERVITMNNSEVGFLSSFETVVLTIMD
jgi:hypothetical protein